MGLRDRRIREQEEAERAEEYTDETDQAPEEYEPTEEELQEYYRQIQAEQQRQYMIEQQQQEAQRRKELAQSPLSILDDIKTDPSPKGALPVLIGGRPVDPHVLEDYIIKISPHALKTILRYHNARTIEEIKNYSRQPALKMKSGSLIIIVLMVIVLIAGIILLMFGPQLTQMMKGLFPM